MARLLTYFNNYLQKALVSLQFHSPRPSSPHILALSRIIEASAECLHPEGPFARSRMLGCQDSRFRNWNRTWTRFSSFSRTPSVCSHV